MVYDDIVIGSGLTAVATAIGLPPSRRVLVLAGPEIGLAQYYDTTRAVPRSYRGFGGMGNYWHGVIPTSSTFPYARHALSDFKALFAYFYPQTQIDEHIGAPWLFVPRKAIRPRLAWQQLATERNGLIQIAYDDALSFDAGGNAVQVTTPNGPHRAQRLWIATGALDTPLLLEASLRQPVAREFVSDHVISYAGQIDRRSHPHVATPEVVFGPEGFFLKAAFDATRTALVTTKPARFGYKTLDRGIEQRAAFGLPTGGAVSKIARAQSLGLFAEALFNKFGLFPRSPVQSVYAQVLVRDAYRFDRADGPLKPLQNNALNAIQSVDIRWPELTRSQRPDLFLKGIHLHHTIDLPAIEATGITGKGSRVTIVDSSILDDIGPEHHSFYTMARAFKAARDSG